MRTPKELYTTASLYTLAGASSAILVTCGVCAYVFEFNPRWLGFVLAEIIAVVGVFTLRDVQKSDPRIWLVAIFNGFLIYSQAVGFNTLNHAFPSPQVKTSTLIPMIDPIPWWPPAEQLEALAAANAALSTAANQIEVAQVALAQSSLGLGPNNETIVARKALERAGNVVSDVRKRTGLRSVFRW